MIRGKFRGVISNTFIQIWQHFIDLELNVISGVEYMNKTLRTEIIPAFHCGGPVSIPGQSMLDLWWTEWHCNTLCSEYICFVLSISFYQCSIPIDAV